MKAATWRTPALICIALALAFAAYQMMLPMAADYGAVSRVDPKSPGVVRIVAVRAHSSAARAGIRPGDRVTFGDTQMERARVLYAPPGSRVPVVVNGSRTAILTAPPAYHDPSLWLPFAIRLAFLVVAGLLAWRRFDDAASRSLAAFLWCFGLTIGMRNTVLPTPALTLVVEQIGSSVLLLLGAGFAAVFAATFPSGTAKPLPHLLARIAVWIAVASSIVAVSSLWLANSAANTSLLNFFLLCAMAIIALFVVVTLIVAYLHGEFAERQRRKWVFFFLAIALGAIGADLAFIALGGYNFIVDLATLPFVAATPFGLAYVILRHRVIDVGFVLNRAVVYTAVSVIVVGVFVMVETLLAKYVESTSHVTSTAVQLAVALALGFSIRYVHARVDRFVDNVLFRERHLAEAAIRTFAHDASYITDLDVLLTRCVQIVEHHAKTLGSGVWLADDAGIYTARAGTFAIAPAVDENDPALVSMRARHVNVHVRDCGSALPGVRAFPMIVRGELLGILVCGQKLDDDTYAPDEEDALASLAAAVGYAADGIEVRDLRRRLAQLTATGGGQPAF
ncbi:MAG TPA: GAF domain-containing protein [Candidatus Baltobacteraceae bacterium]|nr:GAF domain-containing protein [Candidatus Baltobacteraceae bacterium]